MPPTDATQCPSCDYDLGVAHSATGVCPECGCRFDAALLAARSHADISLMLSLIAFGAVGVLMSVAIGGAIVYIPHTGSPGDGYSASGLLSLAPVLAATWGVVMLGVISGTTRGAKCWTGVIAAIFAISAIVKFGAASYAGYVDIPQWLRPVSYRMIAE